MTNELYHYGVLGMKWGVRKDERGLDAYKSRGQKKAERKLAKAEESGNVRRIEKAKDKLGMYKTRDQKRIDYAKVSSDAGSVARLALIGPSGNGAYNRARASGVNRLSSGLMGLGASLIGGAITGSVYNGLGTAAVSSVLGATGSVTLASIATVPAFAASAAVGFGLIKGIGLIRENSEAKRQYKAAKPTRNSFDFD